jgi:Fervidolysin N-terminal prodomain
MIAVVAAATLLASLTLCTSGAAFPPDHSSVKVEIRGVLLPAGPEGRPNAPVVKSNDLTIELQFKDQPPPTEKLQKLFNQAVIVRGLLRKQGADRLICLVDGDVVADMQGIRDAQYLVGFQEGQQKELEALCSKLGLKIVDRYEPGKYLVIEPTEKADDKFLAKLKESPSVRYVEKNMEVRIPEKKGTSTP